MNGIGVSAAQFTAGLIFFQAALNGDNRPRHANGQLLSRRKGFGSLARQYGMISKAPAAKVSQAAKRKACAQSINRKSHRKAVRS